MQQLAQAAGLLVMLAVVSVLARRLSVEELGVFGLLNGIAGYLIIVQNAAAGATVRSIAAGTGTAAAGRSYSTAAAIYAAAGLLSGVLIAALGVVLAAALDLDPAVEHQARLGSLALGAVTAVGWPLTINRDALRAGGLFERAAATEIAALAVYAVLMLGLSLGGGSLALIIGAGGSIPLLAGAGCLVAARMARLPYRLSRANLSREAAREIGGLAGYLSATEAAAAAIFTLDRVILGLFKSAATVGLFEGPVRAHNLLRGLNAATTVTVLPTAARYQAEGDSRRMGELLVRGTRYTVALIAPLAVTGMVLAGPILHLWLGDGYEDGGATMAILLGHWLLNGCSGVLSAVLVGAGRAREVARWAVLVAAANVVLALALTPSLGLEGVALATAVPYVVLFPLLLRPAADAAGLDAGAVSRRGLAPLLIAALPLALALGAARALLPLESPGVLIAVAALAAPAYWAGIYAAVLGPEERRLVRDLARGLRGRGTRPRLPG